jgi:short-subunit dehydrogenase
LNQKYIIITGASSGIGEVFARRYAKENQNLVLVARREKRLTALKEELIKNFNIQVETIVLDLGQVSATETLYSECRKRGLKIYGVVNNAGFGWNGPYSEQDMENIVSMINVNLVSLMKITRVFLSDMIQNKEGLIINVSSIGGFQPVPYFTVYGSLKAAVTNFSIALGEEVKDKNIRVFCLCPGATRTEFADVAEQKDPKTVGGWQTSEEVVEYTFKKLKGKKYFGIPGFLNRIAIFTNRFAPLQFSAKVSGNLMKQ